jgi:hypothetical protein
MWRTLITLFILILSFKGSAQKQLDSLDINTDTIQGHSVKKAIILSSCIPGAGQIYNHLAMPKGKKKAFWKVPLIYASLGTSAYFVLNNQFLQSSVKKEYNNRISGGLLNPEWQLYDNQALLTLHGQFLNNRDLSMLLFFAFYGLQIADAGVEAHFVKFDVSEDISLQVKPKLFSSNQLGVKLQFNFN